MGVPGLTPKPFDCATKGPGATRRSAGAFAGPRVLSDWGLHMKAAEGGAQAAEGGEAFAVPAGAGGVMA
jgi:hypothetical protein